MRYCAKSALLAALTLSLAGVASCDDGIQPDGDGDIECVDGPADQWGNCPDGGDADADSDGDSDGDVVETVTLTVETWTISPDRTEYELDGVAVELRSNARTCPETPCDLTEVTTGEHVLLLTLPGWVQAPIHLAVTQDGVELTEENPAFSSIVLIEGRTISVRMEPDVTGNWRNEETGDIAEIMVYTPPPEHRDVCPFSSLAARGFFSPSAICLEGRTVSRCSTYEQICYDNGLTVVSGVVEDDRITFTECNIYDETACDEHVYTRVD